MSSGLRTWCRPLACDKPLARPSRIRVDTHQAALSALRFRRSLRWLDSSAGADAGAIGRWRRQRRCGCRCFCSVAKLRTQIGVLGRNRVDRCLAVGAHLRVLAAQGFELLFDRSEEHKSELQSLMRITYAVFCL